MSLAPGSTVVDDADAVALPPEMPEATSDEIEAAPADEPIPLAGEDTGEIPGETAAPDDLPPSTPLDALDVANDADCFRRLLRDLEAQVDGEEGTVALVADEIRQALDDDIPAEALLERLTGALADETSSDESLDQALPTLALLAVRGLCRRLVHHDLGGGDPTDRERLVATAGEAIRTLAGSGIAGAIQALPGIVRHLADRAARDRVTGRALIPALRRIAERVAFDPDLVRRLSGRGSVSRPLATAAYGAAAFRQQPVQCRIDGPVEIIIVRR